LRSGRVTRRVLDILDSGRALSIRTDAGVVTVGRRCVAVPAYGETQWEVAYPNGDLFDAFFGAPDVARFVVSQFDRNAVLDAVEAKEAA
jgi:hypothetical protein